ncbi:MAG: hypothetical protein ABH885_07385 [Candidatus Omnitrophota bacterium]
MKKHCKIRGANAAFTLVELLLSLTMTIVIGMGIYKTMSLGISLWEWQKRNQPREDMLIFLERISHDLRNYCRMTEADFTGGSGNISFPVHDTDYVLQPGSVIALAKMKGDAAVDRVEYTLIPAEKRVARKVYKPGGSKPFRESNALTGLRGMVFSYHFVDGTKAPYIADRATGVPPRAVGITLKVIGPGGDVETFTRIIEVPFVVYGTHG